MDSIYTEVFDTDLREHIANPEASFALAMWGLARGAADIPTETSLDDRLDWLMPDLMILRRRKAGWHYDHYGANIAKNAGFSMAGKFVADFKGVLKDFYITCYDRAAGERRPLGTVHRLGRYNERPMWERLILPARMAGDGIALFVVNRVRKHEHDFAQLAARSKGAGILALQFVRSADGAIEDAMISGANAEALAMTGRRFDEVLDHSIRECFPGVVSLALWNRYIDVGTRKESQSFQIDYRADGLDDVFDVKLHPFRDGVAIEFRVLPREQTGGAFQNGPVAA
jgi:hypothetical protein